MKKITLAVAIMAIMAVNQASAEMVDIGTGQMAQSELAALKKMVQGRQPDDVPAIATPRNRPERYGMAAMAPADFQALRDIVAGRSTSDDAMPAGKPVEMISIGTGEMPMDEFIALKKMVAGADIFRLAHLAAAKP
jgi:hypothetical protein